MPVERKVEARWSAEEKRWCCQVQVNGVRRKFYSSKPRTKGKVEAEKKADEWLSTQTFGENLKVSELFADFIKGMDDVGSDSKQYRSIGKCRIIPAIGNKKIGQVTENDLQVILNNAYKDGLSKKSLKNVRGCCTSFIKYCRSRRCTTLFPESLKINKNATPANKRALNPEDLRILFTSDLTTYKENVERDWHIYMYRFHVATGLRPSELFGLFKSDINPHSFEITIRRAFTSHSGWTEGKNENARRTFVLNKQAREAYLSQMEMLKTFNVTSPYLFPNRRGLVCTEQNYRTNLKRYMEYNGIPYVTPYELRHTFVSVNKETPDEYLKLQVGHSEKMTTRETYSHVQRGDAKIAADYSTTAFDKMLSNDEEAAL